MLVAASKQGRANPITASEKQPFALPDHAYSGDDGLVTAFVA
jgi:hypothetical protein